MFCARWRNEWRDIRPAGAARVERQRFGQYWQYDERTVLEIARLVLEKSGSNSEIVFTASRPDDPTQRRPDLTLAGRELGW
jgi:nucleoside-diphosphate-sugar epimerase